MLHHDDAVPLVPQLLQRSDELAVVPLMQADGRLIQDIQHVDQLRADLRRQPDPLPLAARQRSRRPVQRQVVQPHVQHEIHPVRQLLQDVPGDGLFSRIQHFGEMPQPLTQVADLHCGDLRYGLPVDAETFRILIEPRPVADRALDLLVDVLHDAREGHHLRQVPVPDAEQVIGSENKQRQRLVRNIRDRLVQRKAVFAGDGAHDLELPGLAQLAQRHDASVGDAHGAVRHDAVDVHVHDPPQALAVRAIAFRRIEGESMGRRFLQ